jgi:hypothetical protein
MSSQALFRLSGLALLLSLPLQIAGHLMHPPGERVVDLLSPLQQPAHLLAFGAWVLVALGLPALCALQAQRAGVLGLVGYILTMLVAALHFYLLLYETYPVVLMARAEATRDLVATGGELAHGAGALAPIVPVLILAHFVFGVAILRAGVLPRWTGWAQIISVPLFFVAMTLANLAWGPDGGYVLPGWALPSALLYYVLFASFAGGGYVLWTLGERVSTQAAAPTTRASRLGVPQPGA